MVGSGILQAGAIDTRPLNVRARLLGVPVPFCDVSVIVMQQFAAIKYLGWTYSMQSELALLGMACAPATGSYTVCHPLHDTARIKLPTARDEHDWRGHRK